MRREYCLKLFGGKRKFISIPVLLFLNLTIIGFLCSLNKIKLLAPKASVLLLDRNDKYIGALSTEDEKHGFWPLPDRIPDRIIYAVLAAEDKRFYSHSGVDLKALSRAILKNLINIVIITLMEECFAKKKMDHKPQIYGLIVKPNLTLSK